MVPPGRVHPEHDLRPIGGPLALELPGRSVALEQAARLAAGCPDPPQGVVLGSGGPLTSEEDLCPVRRPAGVGGPKVVAREPPGLAAGCGYDPHRPMGFVD